MASSKTPRPSLTRRILRDLRRAPVPVWDLPGQDGTYGQEVVGESLHEVQFARLLRGIHVDANGVDLDEKASLVPRPRTRYDPPAVAVVIRGQTIGHLPHGDAARFHSTLLAATRAGQDPQVDALWCARAVVGGFGTVSNTVRLDLAPLEVVTAS